MMRQSISLVDSVHSLSQSASLFFFFLSTYYVLRTYIGTGIKVNRYNGCPQGLSVCVLLDS